MKIFNFYIQKHEKAKKATEGAEELSERVTIGDELHAPAVEVSDGNTKLILT